MHDSFILSSETLKQNLETTQQRIEAERNAFKGIP
jgi:hypothetical protein